MEELAELIRTRYIRAHKGDGHHHWVKFGIPISVSVVIEKRAIP
jgi:hypothetical protein